MKEIQEFLASLGIYFPLIIAFIGAGGLYYSSQRRKVAAEAGGAELDVRSKELDEFQKQSETIKTLLTDIRQYAEEQAELIRKFNELEVECAKEKQDLRRKLAICQRNLKKKTAELERIQRDLEN